VVSPAPFVHWPVTCVVPCAVTVWSVLQVTPLLVTAGAAVVYGERVGLGRSYVKMDGSSITRPGAKASARAATTPPMA